MSSKEELLISANTEEEISCCDILNEDFSTENTNKKTLDVPEKTSFTRGDTKKENRAREGVPPRDITGWKWGLVVFSVLSSTFIFALDNSIVADIQPVIVTHFDDVDTLSWLSVAFLIGAAGTNLVWGKIFGQFNVLIIGRALCGVGGSGMYVGVMTLLAATTTIHQRPMYVGGTGVTWGLGTVLGPIVGGAFTDSSRKGS
jgi:hypothetical protein